MPGIEGQHPRGQWVDETTDWPQRRIDERREKALAKAHGHPGILVIPDSGDYDLSATFSSADWGPLGPPMVIPDQFVHQVHTVEFPVESIEDETIELLFGGNCIPLHKRKLPAKGQE